ncbi:DCOR-like protein [Mya arenaria]|uniref:DCOR-like protein n=1 Tax=Mya arenaria TaxID=6604 RepID=A0ABY7FNP1_MYAAR|nr:DCOR-like protein [Mya arenaria]
MFCMFSNFTMIHAGFTKSLQSLHISLSFHVGSGCEEPEAFSVAIQQARVVFDQGLDLGFPMTLLDIGGGFPGHEAAPVKFETVAKTVDMALDRYFPSEEGVEIISEPGRYFVASAFTLGVNIIAKRVVSRDQQGENGELIDQPSLSEEPAIMYYVNDGVYGSFNCLLYDHAEVSVNTLKNADEDDDEFKYESSVWGPTCDGLDCILKSVPMGMHDVGEWLYFRDMGAYTVSAASTFNGMPAPTRTYMCDADLWYEVYPNVCKSYHKAGVCKGLPKMKAGHSLQEEWSPAPGCAESFVCN